MRAVSILALLLVALVALPAFGKESAAVGKANALLAEAETSCKAKEWEKAARSLAEEVTLAQQEKDLALEARGAEALEKLLDALEDEPAPKGDTTAVAGPREVLAIVMRVLDPARHGAYLSAHVLATELLLDAVEQGDAVHLDAAEAVLITFAATPKCGKAPAALLQLAKGVKAARAGDAKSAGTALEATLPLVKLGRWLRLTLAAELERMLVQLAAGDAAAVATTLQEAVGYLAPKQDVVLAHRWVKAARRRLAGASPEVRSALERAVEPYVREGEPGADGGRGGNGGNAESVSALGRAWPKLPGDKPFATVKRGEAGHDIRAVHDKKLAGTHPYNSGQSTWDQDGLTFVFADGGVALRMLDMQGTASQPGGRAAPSPAWGWYLLAPGETYGVTKAGLVVVN